MQQLRSEAGARMHACFEKKKNKKMNPYSFPFSMDSPPFRTTGTQRARIRRARNSLNAIPYAVVESAKMAQSKKGVTPQPPKPPK